MSSLSRCRPTAVIAHRGAHGAGAGAGAGAGENTLLAFERAIELGADMIEFDVRRTRDGRLAVFHDSAVDGVALAELTHRELRERAGVAVPLLGEVLELTGGRIGLDVECKENGTAEEVVATLAPAIARGEELLITSFSDTLLADVRRVAPALRTGLLLAWGTDGATERARACGAADILPSALLASGQFLDAAEAAGLGCLVWSIEPGKDDALLRDGRVRGVITDDVPAALRARDQT